LKGLDKPRPLVLKNGEQLGVGRRDKANYEICVAGYQSQRGQEPAENGKIVSPVHAINAENEKSLH